MKKIVSLILTVFIILGVISGCSKEQAGTEGELKIVTTSFAAFDWCKNILGDKLNSVVIELLSDNGVDMHSYQPTADDVLKIYESDIFIYVGGTSDAWSVDILKNPSNKEKKTINMLKAIGDRAILNKYEHGHENHGHEENKKEEYDEHIWLSLKNAEIICKDIYNALSSVDSKNKGVYEQNFNSYKDELSKIEADYTVLTQRNMKKPLIFADRFPFKYFANDYGIICYASFPNCSTESEACFDSVIELSEKIDEYSVEYVFTVDNSDKKLADTVVKNTKHKNQKILILNSMQAVNKKDIKKGLSYISVMRENISLMIKAF